MGFETPEEGFLAKILIPEGTKDVPLGQVMNPMEKDNAFSFFGGLSYALMLLLVHI